MASASDSSARGSTDAPTSSSVGPTRTTKIRACDRCRQRKHKCDEILPCTSCRDANAVCKLTSIPQKRGPRPRERPGTTQLEQRLAHLEQLLASIPHSASGNALSEEERQEIRRAAQGRSGSASSATPVEEGGLERGRRESLESVGYAAAARTERGEGGQGGILGYEFGGAFSAVPPPYLRSNPYGETLSPHTSPLGSTIGLPAAASSRRNLIYRDKEGELRFVGPSSGLPLLGLLKELKDSDLPESDPSRTSPSNVDHKPTLQERDRGEKGAAMGGATVGNGLWARVAEVMSAELMDELVRGYFNVSHLLWPILHMPSFLTSYLPPHRSHHPDFIVLVLSMCCLSSRYLDDPRTLSQAGKPGTAGLALFELAKKILREEMAGRISLPVVQATFNLAVFAEGSIKPSTSLVLLSEAVTLALDMGLHRRVDDWAAFSAVEIEVRKRVFWSIYCMSAKACATFGRPPLIRLADCDVQEPFAVDDAFITDEGVGIQPLDTPSIQAGFVAAIRLHMLLERTLEVINSVPCDPAENAFASMVLSQEARPDFSFPSDYLLNSFARGLPGDWEFTPTAINDSDTVRFFQRTRAYALQQFIRLLIARHKLLYDVEQASSASNGLHADTEMANLQHLTQAALGIVGCYATIKARGRLRLFGVHAIAQLTQSGSALICVILHTQGTNKPMDQQLLIVALEGLSACIAVLRHLGERRPAGTKGANVLEEFARACDVSLGSSPSPPPTDDSDAGIASDVPMLRVLPRRHSMRRAPPARADTVEASTLDWMLQAAFGGSEAGSFLPPPRFGVTDSGTWSSSVRSPASLIPDFSMLGTQGGENVVGDSAGWTGAVGPSYQLSPQVEPWPW